MTRVVLGIDKKVGFGEWISHSLAIGYPLSVVGGTVIALDMSLSQLRLL